MLTRLIHGEEDGERLSEAELLHNCIFILNAGHETTTNLIGNGLVRSRRGPASSERLRAGAGAAGQRGRGMPAFRELEPARQPDRRRRSFIDDAPVARGTPVTLCIGAANRDPAQFEAPERFDIGREPNRHLAFGFGVRQCAGLSLARLEARIAIGRFVARFPAYRMSGEPERAARARFRGFVRAPVSIE